ncbi:hypothetical protein VPH35_031601 [Triticum aestivum]
MEFGSITASQTPQPPLAAAMERIYKPEDLARFEPRLTVVNRERSELLQKIRGSYDRARARLATATAFEEEVFLGAGLSIGLLEPTTNIIYNTLVASSLRAEKIRGGDMAERSMDGLVAFLTTLFRYLADWEAVRYLLRADADLVYAVRLVAHDRSLSPFHLNSDASKPVVRTALMCAALASKHTDGHHLVGTWLSPVCPLEEAVHAIQNDINNFTCVFNFNARHQAPGMQTQPLDFAWKRALELRQSPLTTNRRAASTLMALSLMPTSELRSCYHRSMLKAGHCYGPFDPVSNIIINTIWYNTVSPPSQRPEIDMISTGSLLRIEARSFYGLVSFLCTSGKNLYEAMCFLLITDCTLGKSAAPFSNPLAHFGDQDKICHAFRAAGVAAWHPDPVAQAEFISSCSHTFSCLKINAPLNSADVGRITREVFQGRPTPGNSLQHQAVPMPKLSRYEIIRTDEHTRISRKVRAALASYALEIRELYDLHVICGVNHNVSGLFTAWILTNPFSYTITFMSIFLQVQEVEIQNSSLLNLAMTTRQRMEAGRSCVVLWISPNHTKQTRCMYCDHEGTKIVHPAMEEFQFKGRNLEFQNMACGIDPYEEEPCPDGVMQFYMNYSIISISCEPLDHVGAVDDDTDDDTDEEYDSNCISESESE